MDGKFDLEYVLNQQKNQDNSLMDSLIAGALSMDHSNSLKRVSKEWEDLLDDTKQRSDDDLVD